MAWRCEAHLDVDRKGCHAHMNPMSHFSWMVAHQSQRARVRWRVRTPLGSRTSTRPRQHRRNSHGGILHPSSFFFFFSRVVETFVLYDEIHRRQWRTTKTCPKRVLAWDRNVQEKKTRVKDVPTEAHVQMDRRRNKPKRTRRRWRQG